jgi:predicted aldo/keto reductase-like oxidoreductase
MSKELKKLGETGPKVFPLGLGCMGFSGMYGPTDDAESVATIHAAIDAGVTLLDRASRSLTCIALLGSTQRYRSKTRLARSRI